MKTQRIVAFWLVSGLSLYAGSNPGAERLLLAANQQRNIFHGQGSSFQLEIDFTAQLNVPTNGHLNLQWKDEDHWRIAVSIAGFEEVEVQNGEWTHTARNLGFTPIRVQELMGLIHLTDRALYIGRKWKARVDDGISLHCVQAGRDDFKAELREFCLDATTHDVLSESWGWGPDEKRRESFAGYFDFQGHRYPRKLEMEVNGSRVIKADVTSLVSAEFNDALLTPPQGAIPRRHCSGMKYAQAVKQPDMPFVGAKGDSTVVMTILADGTVGDAQVIARGGKRLDQANLDNLKQWRFKPAMCGSEPVVSEIQITTTVRRN
jgi:hypothetical protein